MDERRCTLGLDVGGTKIAGVALGAGGEVVVERRTIPTDLGRVGDDILDRAVALAEDLAACAADAGFAVGAIGVGVPEVVSLDGAIVSDGVIPWKNLPVGERFSVIAPAILDSDVRAAARAEAELGAGRGLHSFAYVNVGTGVSSTVVIEGHPYAGAHGGALVLASGPTTGRCPSCNREFSLVVEEIASGPAIVSRCRRLGGHADGARDVIDQAGAGIAPALQTLQEAADALGSAIGQLINILDPEAIVVGGGLGATPGAYWGALVPAVRAHIWWDGARDIPILQTSLGADAGALGAALSARALLTR